MEDPENLGSGMAGAGDSLVKQYPPATHQFLEMPISIISEYPKKELVPSGINIYAEAGSFRTAEYLGQSIILPLAPFFQEEDIESILSAASENGQICYASGTPEILEQLFNQTRHLLQESRPHWQKFVDHQVVATQGDGTERYAYLGLQKLLAE